MICENCELFNEINSLGRYLIDNNLGTEFFAIQKDFLSSGKNRCTSCKKKLNSKEYFYKDEQDLLDRLRTLTAKTFSDLSLYNGSNEDDIFYNSRDFFSEPGEHPELLQNRLGEPKTIDEVIKESLFFAPNLLCSFYSKIYTYIDKKVFDTDDHELPITSDTNVLTSEAKEYTAENLYEEFNSPIDELISYIYKVNDNELNYLQKDELNNKFLEKNETYQKLKELFRNLINNHYGLNINEKNFYRARLMTTEEIIRLSTCNENELKSEALTPPIGIPSQGRWNFGGKPTVLYVSDAYPHLAKEINYSKEKSDKKLVIFDLKTNKKRFFIPISLLAYSSHLYNMLTKKVDKANLKEYNQQYILSNLLGKIILNSQYDGIIYDPTIYQKSEIKYNSLPMNYAIFNPDITNLECFKDVTVNDFFCL